MKQVVVLASLLCSCFVLRAQDMPLINSNQSLISYNPSFAGSNGGIRNQLSYGNEYISYRGSPQFVTNSFDAFIQPLRGGIAVSVNTHQTGSIKNAGFGAAYAQHLSFFEGRIKLIPSIQLTYNKKELDYSWIYNLPGPQPCPDQTHAKYTDLASALLISHNDRLFLGLTVHNLNSPIMCGNERLNPLAVLYGSYNAKLSDRSVLQIAYTAIQRPDLTDSRVAWSLLLAEHYVAGIGLTSWEEIPLNCGYRAKHFSVMVCCNLDYGATVSDSFGDKFQSWELHASYNLRRTSPAKQINSFETF